MCVGAARIMMGVPTMGGGLQRFPQTDTYTNGKFVCVHVYGYVRRCVGLYELRASFPQAIVGRTIAVATNHNSSNNLFSFSLHYGRGVVGGGMYKTKRIVVILKRIYKMYIYSVPDGVLNGGVGATCAAATVASTFTGGNTRFSLFFDILTKMHGKKKTNRKR